MKKHVSPIGCRNVAIGSVKAASVRILKIADQLASHINPRQMQELVQCSDNLVRLYNELADKYYKNGGNK